MRKLICLLTVMAICLCLGVSAFAAENEFTPSIGYKDGPEILEALLDEAEVDECVIVSTIKEATDKTTDISQHDRDLLLEVYEQLKNGDMKLPIEGKYVIRDLVDVSFEYVDCREIEDHGNKPEQLKEEGVTLTITFDLGIGKDEVIDVYVYEEETVARSTSGKWVSAKSVKNNGDGTLTVVFEDICPVAFVVKEEESSKTGDNSPIALFAAMMLVSAAGVATMVCIKKKAN